MPALPGAPGVYLGAEGFGKINVFVTASFYYTLFSSGTVLAKGGS